MRGLLTKSLPYQILSSEKVLGVWEAVQEKINPYWLMQWVNCRIQKTRECAVLRNFVGARNLKGLSALGILSLEGLLLFAYLN